MLSYRIGVDEVGRGCLAGPLLVVAVREKNALPTGLKDSKLMTKAQRVKMLDLLSICCDFGEGWVTPREIDNHGLAEAMRLGVARALKRLDAHPNDKIILDGPVNYLPNVFKVYDCLVDADEKIPLVSAASVYAKVIRDRFMIALAKQYKNYGFENHVGYATAKHQAALAKLGPLDNIHRFSFRGVNL